MGKRSTQKGSVTVADQKNEKRTILVGLGRMGFNHLRVLKEHPNFSVVAIVEPDKKKQKLINDSSIEIFPSVDSLNKLKIDCAIVAAPTEFHEQIGKWLVSNDIPFLMEKPLCARTLQCRELSYIAVKKNLPIAIGHLERFNPAVLKLSEVIKHGWIGNPIHFSFTRVGGYPENVSPANNVLIDLATHDIDVLTRLNGTMQFKASACHSTRGNGIYDTAEILLSNKKGASASIHVNWITPTKIRTLRVTGTKGVAFVDYMLQTCTVFGGNLIPRLEPKLAFKQLVTAYQNTDRIEFGVEKEEPLKLQLQHFYRLLKKERNDCCTPEEATLAVKLAEEAIRYAAD